MIRYALCCDDGHRFDSWFYDSSAFDEQARRGLVACPVCDSHHVVKAIMAPAVVAGRRAGLAGGADPAATEAAPAKDAPVEVALVDDERRQLVRAFRDKVLAETRDVGRDFATEARRIHAKGDRDGDATAKVPADRIRGQATLEEARDLLEDGIMVLPLPALPDDLN